MPRPGYQAFISYSHSADGAFAPALQRGMQQLGRSWRQRRAMEVFRDETGLAVDPNLWGAITAALDGSEWFVLLASPRAAASHWVGQEIEHCIATKGADRFLIVLTEGILRWDGASGDFSPDSDAAHPALRGLLTSEPAIVDLSWARQDTDLSLDNARFRADVARIVALIRGEPLAAVTAHDARERRRTKTVVGSALGLLAAATAIAVVAASGAAVSWRTASVEQAAAEDEARVALAREFAAQARIAEVPRAALALAVEALALAPDAGLEGSLLSAVSGAGANLVTLPALLPEGYRSADIRSSSSSGDGGGRLTLSTQSGSLAVDLATGQEWRLPGHLHYLTPDGTHAIGADGTIVALGDDGSAEPVAAVPALGSEPSFTADGSVFAYRHDSPAGSQLTVADVTGEGIRSLPVPLGSECAGCSGDASVFAIAPDGSRVVARIAPSFAETSVRAQLTSYAIEPDALRVLTTVDVAGVGAVRFSDDSAAVWARDDGAVLVLDPATLQPVAESMSVSRAGPLQFASDTLALAPADNCTLPGVVVPPTMATVAELPADLVFAESGCYDDVSNGSEPRWLLGGTWVRTSAGIWPTDTGQLLEIACTALGGTVPADEFAELSGTSHMPIGCADPLEES